MRGIDSNYGIEARRSGLGWTRAGRPIDPVEHLSAAGTGWIRIRVFTPHTTTNGLRYAGETALAAQRAGLTSFVSLFLTDRWATAEEQPVPQAWHRLTFPERVRAVREYAGMAAGYLKGLGVETDLFSIGNEIDYGVCGSYCEDQTKRESIWWMTERDDTWTRTAELILAGMEGVRSAYPRARFVAHLAHWFNPEFGVGFFRSMRAYGLRFDLIGASYYPTSGIPEDHFGTSNTQADCFRIDRRSSPLGEECPPEVQAPEGALA